jgi:hypothetical protein
VKIGTRLRLRRISLWLKLVRVRRNQQEKNSARNAMSKKIFCLALSAVFFALSFSADAQQPKKVPRIGYLSNTDPATESTRSEAFRQGLRELGYIEGLTHRTLGAADFLSRLSQSQKLLHINFTVHEFLSCLAL